MSNQNIKKGAALSAGAVLAIAGVADNAGSSTETQITIGTEYSIWSGGDLYFDTVMSATDLVSIDDASVFTGEGWGIDVSLIKTDNSLVSVFDGSSVSGGMTVPLSDLTSNNYSEFAESDIKGLRFDLGPLAEVVIPAGAILTFAVIPEPATALLMGLGLLVFSSSRLRKWSQR